MSKFYICVYDALKAGKLWVSASRNLLVLLFRCKVEKKCEQKCVIQKYRTYLAKKKKKTKQCAKWEQILAT